MSLLTFLTVVSLPSWMTARITQPVNVVTTKTCNIAFPGAILSIISIRTSWTKNLSFIYFLSILQVLISICSNQLTTLHYMAWKYAGAWFQVYGALSDIDLKKMIYLHWLQNPEVYPGLHPFRHIPFIWWHCKLTAHCPHWLKHPSPNIPPEHSMDNETFVILNL